MRFPKLYISQLTLGLALIQLCSSCSTQERTGGRLITKRLYQKGYHLQVEKSRAYKPLVEVAFVDSGSEPIRQPNVDLTQDVIQDLEPLLFDGGRQVAQRVNRAENMDAQSEVHLSDYSHLGESVLAISDTILPEHHRPYLAKAIVGFGTAIVFAPVGLVISLKALKIFKAEPDIWQGKDLAVAGAIIGAVFTAYSAFAIGWLIYSWSTWY